MKPKKAEYVPGPPVDVQPMCNCLSFQYPHGLAAHRKLRSMTDWRTWQQIESEGK